MQHHIYCQGNPNIDWAVSPNPAICHQQLWGSELQGYMVAPSTLGELGLAYTGITWQSIWRYLPGEGALPYVCGYQVPVIRHPFLRRSYTPWPPPFFHISHPMTPPFSTFESNFTTNCKFSRSSRISRNLQIYKKIEYHRANSSIKGTNGRQKTYEIFHVYCILYSGFMCQTTVFFGITKDGSLVLNTLASWNCFTCRNFF